MPTPTRTWLWTLSCALLFGAACDERREAGTGPVDASAAAVGVDAGTRPAALTVTEYVRDAGAASLAEPAPNLGGEVIDLYDERVVGARVTCAGAQVRTGEDGRYALPCAPGHKVFAQAVGYDAVEARAPGLATVRQLALRLQAAGTIGGSTVTTEGAALADVRVELAGSGVWPPRRTTTDGHGRFAFASVPEGIYELRASRPAQANPAALASAIKREVAVEGPGGAATADLVLSPAGELVGRVADGDGRGLAAVRLSLADSALPLLGDGTVSDDRGAFRFGPLAPGMYRLRAEARTLWQDAPAEVLVGAGTTTFHLSVAAGARIEGRALSAEGEPVSGARVAVRHGEHGTLTSLHRRKSRVRVFAARTGARGLDAEDAAANATSTDAAGRFVVEGLPAGPAQLLMWHPKQGNAASERFELRAGETLKDVSLRLTPACALTGRVMSEQDNPKDGARVVVEDAQGLWPRRVVRAGEGGVFKVVGLACGPVVASTAETGHTGQRVLVELSQGRVADVTLRLLRGEVTIEGLVLDLEERPLAGATVTLSAEGQALVAPRHASSDDVGSFRFNALPKGRYAVRVDLAGFAPESRAGLDGRSAVEVRLLAAGGLAGQVVNESGDALEATIALKYADADQPPRLIKTDAHGKYRSGVLAEGRYEVRAEADGYEPTQLFDVLVEPGGGPELTLTLRKRVE